MSKVDPVDAFYVQGFPFEEMRPGQGPVIANVLRGIVEEDVRFHIIRAPTGSGKSPIAVAIAKGMHAVLNEILAAHDPVTWGQESRRQYDLAVQKPERTAQKTECVEAQQMPWYESFVPVSTSPLYCPSSTPRFLFATPRKALQDQYIESFAHLQGFCTLKGKGNYTCGYDSDAQADSCGVYDKANAQDPDRPEHCFLYKGCPYRKAARRALVTHPYVILNFHSLQSWLWMAWESSMGANVKYKMLLIDECHLLPEFLVDYASVKIDLDAIEQDVDDMLDPETTTPPGVYANWDELWFDVSEIATKLRGNGELSWQDTVTLSYLSPVCVRLAHEYEHLGKKQERYAYLKKERVLSEVLDGYRAILKGKMTHDQYQYFMEVSEDAPDVIGLHCKNPREGFRKLAKNFQHIVMMSGTVSPDAFREQLGLTKEQTSIHDMGITIPYTYRPFIALGDRNATNMAYKTRDAALPVIADNIVKLANFHSDWRGIIHTQSAKNAQALYDLLRQRLPRARRSNNPTRIGRFIFHYRGSKVRELEAFMHDTSDNSILVSPSLAEGFDGKDDVARWQCIIKIPYLPRNSGEVKARLLESDGELWYTLQTINTLSQMYGRVNRHPTDFGITYMLDGGWNGFVWRVGKDQVWPHAPAVFQEGVATSGEFVYPFKNGKLLPIPTHKDHPVVKNATRTLPPEKLMEYLDG